MFCFVASIYYTGQRQVWYKPTRLTDTFALKASEWAGGHDLTQGESSHSLLGLAAMLARHGKRATAENKTRIEFKEASAFKVRLK